MKKVILCILVICMFAVSGCKSSSNEQATSAVLEKNTSQASSSQAVSSSSKAASSVSSSFSEPQAADVTEEKLAGNWVVDSSYLNGKKQDISSYSSMIVTFKDGFFSLTNNGLITVSGTYTISGADVSYTANGKEATMKYTVDGSLSATEKSGTDQIITIYKKLN